MRKIVEISLFVLLIFLSFDSLGLASLAYVWQAANFFRIDATHYPIAESVQVPVKAQIQTPSSLNDLFDYRSFRRVQASA